MKLTGNGLDALISACKNVDLINRKNNNDPPIALFSKKDLPSLKRLYGNHVEFGDVVRTQLGSFRILEDRKV